MTTDKYIEIVDTTLRDGEQTPGVSYTPEEKLQLAQILLAQVKVDRLEVGSARVSEGEAKGVRKIITWAKKKNFLDKIEILGFIDKGKSIDWVKANGGKVINLLTKGSRTHCEGQLRKTPEQHFTEVCADIDYAKSQGIEVNVYLEDWSSGMRDDIGYVFSFMNELIKHDVKHIMLADTLGISNPESLKRHFDWMRYAFPSVQYDFHGHNDYGLVSGNNFVAIATGISGIHTTVNGLGERTGNQSLAEVTAIIHDMTGYQTHVEEKNLAFISNLVQTVSRKRVASNAPIIGSDVFTQTCGVHADGDKKGNLYANALLPERFNRVRQYALGKLSGKASIDKNLEKMGLELSDDIRDKVLAEVIRLGDKKERVTPEDLPFIIAGILNTSCEQQLIVSNYDIKTSLKTAPTAEVELTYQNNSYSATAEGDGGYDAFVKATRLALKELDLAMPMLGDYTVHIPPGGKTDALVETTIVWQFSDDRANIVTTGVDCDQMVAAIKATEKMLNLLLINK